MGDSAVVLEGVTKKFGPVSAADNITLNVGAEFFALLGPSGSGKTTMLRIIAGLERPDTGRVLVDGVDVTALPPYKRGVGMVFQDFLLFPHRTVAENIMFPLRMQGVAPDERKKSLAWISNLVRLEGLEGRYPHQLSGGQKQRVALARGLVSRPKLLLLDEPLANLDRELRKEMEIEIRRFQIELGIPFIYVTHNQEEALTMSDRMAVMRAGKLEQVGGNLELYHDPKSQFVASFLGAPNSFGGIVTACDANVASINWAGRTVTAKTLSNITAGTPVRFYIKSEKVRLSEPGQGAPGVVRDAIFKGQYADYIIDLDQGGQIIVSGPPKAELFAKGLKIAVDWAAEDAHAFAEGT